MAGADRAKPSVPRPLAATLGWTVFAACASACSLDWSFSEGDGGRLDASDASVVGERGDGTEDTGADVAQADTASPDDAPSDAAKDTASGCHSNAECGGTAFCHYPDHRCGQGVGGACIPRPSNCPVSTPYACTCSGAIDVTGPCGAESMGNDVSVLGCASPPPGSVCGYVYCITACVQGTVAGETTYDCQ
jgi:hypothetical protein